tara:strand:+ start:26124 stop:26789 length:666 start_codon:yes stop_codon:yes gene_type:complete
MKTSTKVFIISMGLTFLCSTVGLVLSFSTIMGGGETVATQTAPGELQFEATSFGNYDIYAEDSEIHVVLGNFSYASRQTFLEMCSLLGNENVTLMTGECGTLRGNQTLVGSLVVGDDDVGTVLLNLNGTGEVSIVKVSDARLLMNMSFLCFGCCLGPVIVLISGITAFKSSSKTDVSLVEQSLPEHLDESVEDLMPDHKAMYPTSTDRPNEKGDEHSDTVD